MMPVDWRGLFSSIRVEWKDRGPNTSRGNVNIRCPWCANDPGFHLGVAESKDAYYCFREPNRHSGTSVLYLLTKLGATRLEAAQLLKRYHRAAPAERTTSSNEQTPPPQSTWDRFQVAATNRTALNYLSGRGFADPQLLCMRYDLRIAPEGRWAQRLLIPYYRHGVVEGFSGRALDGRFKPKYLMNRADLDHTTIYSPSREVIADRRLVVVEGQFDALKLAAALPERDYLVVALCGKNVNAGKILRILELNGGVCSNALIALDNDVSTTSAYQIINDLASALKCCYARRAKLPPSCEDPGELPTTEIPRWVQSQYVQGSD